jgi:FtsP/CotA-like multicopper oxidase with cupredoxin domain
MDGVVDVTQKVIAPGETFTYEFVAQPGGTFMYHTHHNSAVQEGKGLYGLFIVDPKVPTVQYDKEYIQVLSELGGYYLINGKAFPATEPIQAKVGERVLIRLVNLGQMTHPMHMHGQPFQIVGTDGYPVPEAQALTKDVINIGPGERYDLLMTADNPGTWLFHCHILTHVQNHGVEPGGMITVVKVDE